MTSMRQPKILNAGDVSIAVVDVSADATEDAEPPRAAVTDYADNPPARRGGHPGPVSDELSDMLLWAHSKSPGHDADGSGMDSMASDLAAVWAVATAS